MDEEQASLWEVWGTRIISALSTTAILYCALTFELPGGGRLLDKLSAYIPRSAAPAGLSMQAPSKAAMTQTTSAPNLTPALAEKTEPVQALPAPAKAAPTETVAATPTPHLTTTLRTVPIHDDNSQTSASVSVDAPMAAPAADQAPSQSPTAASPLQVNAASQPRPITVSYGNASRSEIMGKAAGPVYNLKDSGKP